MLIVQMLIALIFHPVAVILAWVNLADRDDLTGTQKLVWALVCLIWGIGPILYMLLANGRLW